jgi:hypothetical protein
MKHEMKKQPAFSLGKQIAAKQQKKVLGGASAPSTRKCKGAGMSCTTAPITSGYCWAVWPISQGVVCTCGTAGCS